MTTMLVPGHRGLLGSDGALPPLLYKLPCWDAERLHCMSRSATPNSPPYPQLEGLKCRTHDLKQPAGGTYLIPDISTITITVTDWNENSPLQCRVGDSTEQAPTPSSYTFVLDFEWLKGEDITTRVCGSWTQWLKLHRLKWWSGFSKHSVLEEQNFAVVLNQLKGTLPLENGHHRFSAQLLLSPSLATWSNISQMTFQWPNSFLPSRLLTRASVLKNSIALRNRKAAQANARGQNSLPDHVLHTHSLPYNTPPAEQPVTVTSKRCTSPISHGTVDLCTHRATQRGTLLIFARPWACSSTASSPLERRMCLLGQPEFYLEV